MRKTICFILNICVCHIAFGQEDEIHRDVILLEKPLKELHLITSGSINQSAQLDRLVSPLVYNGWNAGGGMGLMRRRERNIYQLCAQYHQGKLRNKLQPYQYYANLQQMHFNISGCYHFPLPHFNYIRSYAGWQITHQSDFRNNTQFQNASTTYNVSTSFAPMLRFEKLWLIRENQTRKIFKKQRYIRFSYQLSLPVLEGISRPPYNAIRQINDGSGGVYQNSLSQEIIQQYKVHSMNHFLAIYSLFDVQFSLQNGNRWALQYYWNYEQFNVVNQIYKTGQAGFQLSFYTRLNAL